MVLFSFMGTAPAFSASRSTPFHISESGGPHPLASRRGAPGPAREHTPPAIAASDGSFFEIYNNLGAMLVRTGHDDRARRCFQIVLDADPGNSYAEERLAELELPKP